MRGSSAPASTSLSPSAAGLAAAIRGVPVVSCDIFDTAVMRVLARPEDIHLATGARAIERGLVTCHPEAFQQFRLEAERAARRESDAAGREEMHIADVYDLLERCGVVAKGQAGAAAELEFAVERSLARPVEELRQALSAIDPGQRLIFLSDSLFPGEWLSRLLADCGYGDACTVFSSADAGCSKHGGGLYAHVTAALNCAASDIVHVGDNPIVDIANARRQGLKTVLVPRPLLPPEDDAVAGTHWLLRLTHSMRRSRGQQSLAPMNGKTNGHANGHDDFAGLHHYLSALLVGFTLFVLGEARRRGIDRIYFLSRDGYLPLAIANRLTAQDSHRPEMSYLYASRQSIFVPTLTDDLDRLSTEIAQASPGRPLRSALGFLGIDDGETARMFSGLGIDPNQVMHGNSGNEPIRRLFDAHRDMLRTRLLDRRAAALTYLDEAGFLKPGPRLIVDVGWRGTTQLALSALTGVPAADIAGCYLGLLPQALRLGLDPRTASGYLFSFGHPKPVLDTVLDGYVLFDLFFSAPHGSVSHYAAKDNRMVPVFSVEGEPGAGIRRQALAALESGCLEEFDGLDAIIDSAWPDAIDTASALFDLAPLLTCPTATEVARINKIPFINSVNGSHNYVPVNPVPFRELLLHPEAVVRRIGHAPWRSGTLRASLPWPVPSMRFTDFRRRMTRLQHLLRRPQA